MAETRPSRKDACSLNLHGLQCVCKPGLDPVLQVIQLSCLLPNGVTSGSCHLSLGLSLILKEVAGGSGRLRPLLALRSELGEHLPRVSFFFFLMSKSCIPCSLESKHFQKETACPPSRAHEATFQGPVYMAAASIPGSQPIAGTILPLLQFAP